MQTIKYWSKLRVFYLGAHGGDGIARLGGDEFSIILEAIATPKDA